MSVKVLAIGDPHFTLKSQERHRLFIEEVLRVVRETRPDWVVVLGDTLHNHNRVEIYAFTQAISFLSQLAAITPTYLLIGNHDRPNNSDFLSQFHFFQGMEQVSGLTIIDRGQSVEWNGYHFLMVPYVPVGRFQEALELIKTRPLTEYTAIFAHQQLNDVIKYEEGDPWTSDAPLVISGHIHEYQELGGNIVYSGSALQVDFNETPDKALCLFTFKDKQFEYERIPMAVPAKVQLRCSAEEFVSIDLSELHSQYEIRENLYHEVKLIICGTEAELRSLQSKLKQLKFTYSQIITDARKEKPSNPKRECCSFRDLYREAVSHQSDKDLIKTYQRIFV